MTVGKGTRSPSPRPCFFVPGWSTSPFPWTTSARTLSSCAGASTPTSSFPMALGGLQRHHGELFAQRLRTHALADGCEEQRREKGLGRQGDHRAQRGAVDHAQARAEGADREHQRKAPHLGRDSRYHVPSLQPCLRPLDGCGQDSMPAGRGGEVAGIELSGSGLYQRA